jgi:hypothetical protein
MKVCRSETAVALCFGLALLACSAASAEYVTNFDPPTFDGSAEGVVMSGQDGWYLPDGVDYNVYTYEGNVLGVATNPLGNTQFVAGVGPGGVYARAQHDIDWSTAGVWEIEYDVATLYDGDPPGANNLGSFSIQPSADSVGSMIHLFSWVDPDIATNWNAFYMHYDAAGNQVAQPGTSPGPEWGNLDLNHWYHFEMTVDFDVNMITEVGITDITGGGDPVYYEPADWYLSGGDVGGPPTVTALRLFAGGGVPGNTVAWDNLSVIPEPATLSTLLLASLALLRRRG